MRASPLLTLLRRRVPAHNAPCPPCPPQVDKVAEVKRVSFAVHIDAAVDGDWMYISDDARILQVFSCLIARAVTYTRKDSTVTVKTFLLPTGKPTDSVFVRVRFEATDMSKEVAPELQAALLQPYVPGEKFSRAAGQSASGLHMNVVKSILPLMGGTLGCCRNDKKSTSSSSSSSSSSQTAPQGTTFWVEVGPAQIFTQAFSEN